MAAALAPDPQLGSGLGAGALDRGKMAAEPPPPPQVHTPPTTDEGSHKDDDAASSSSLSDLGDDIEDDENRMRFEEAARAGAEAEQHTEIKPDRYENGVPIFTPTMDEFREFDKYVAAVDPYGMQSGIVLIDPPEEWKRQRKALDEMIKTIKIKNPITQEFHGAQGIYTQRNMEKMRSYNLPQWKATCEQTENQPPARRGQKRLNADKLIGRGAIKNKKSVSSPMPESGKRRGRARVNPIKHEPLEESSNLGAPPTPTSPALQPSTPAMTEDADEEEDDPAGLTPSKAKKGRKPGPKPKGRQPKATTKKDTGKGSETTVAARRLRNVFASAEEIDEDAFEDFDYRVYDNDQWTAERCDELEEKYWKSLNFSNPMYAADMPGSLFDEETTSWNVAKLPNLLDLLGQPIPGVNTAYLYLGMWRATFAWHLEDVDLYSINYIHFGAPKQWYSISQKDAPKFEAAMKSIWGQDAKSCDQFLRHKTYLVAPSILKSKYGINVNRVVHREGQFVITFPIGYHSGYNLGYNCAESVNFAIENWLRYGKTARKCQCEADSVFIDVDWFIRKMNGEPTPEYEEVEVTDDEDDDEPTDLPTPPGSDRGKVKVPSKRKRGPKDTGPNKKAKKMIKIRKISKYQPCCLCPNDFDWEELLPTSHGQKAHRTCAMYTPETYIATKDGQELVFNVEGISKARMELKCYECRQKKGSCFQCSSAKCTKSYHATCAMQAGVQVDKGEIAVWVEGIEYRDIGFDWRCRLHRTVKRQRITSELSTCNHANNCWDNTEFTQHLSALKAGELVQYQPTHADEIEAGVVVSGFDAGQGSVLVKVLPEQRIIKEVEAAWILFVDSATSCLQRPSAAALDLPEELQGRTASLPESTDRKPSEGDPFTEEPKTEWAEFVSNEPPRNKEQKPVDLTKSKQLWLYLGKTSTDSKAHFTADPQKPFHDPASVYLDTVEPASRSIMAPPLQPKRQSLPASFPVVNIAARNAAMTTFRQYAHMPSQPGAVPVSLGPAHHTVMKAARDQVVSAQVNPQRKDPQHRDQLAAQEARANEQARILQRQQAKAQHLDMQEGQHKSPTPGIGIDQGAVERQRQFQQLASLQSRSMNQQLSSSIDQSQDSYQYKSTHAAMHNDALPRPQQPQHSNDWMTNGAMQRRTSFGQQPHMPSTPVAPSPTMSQYHSPQMSTVGRFPSYVEQSHMQFPLGQGQGSFPNDIERFRSETARIESIRAAANQPPPPPPSAAVERQRRISNPAYPFKSRDQIKAQKEAEKNSPPGSRPGSSYMQSSPVIKQEGYSQGGDVDPQNPPQYINPNATQISPPGSSAGRHSASNSLSGTPITMGPPLPPTAKRTVSAGLSHDTTTFPTPMMPSVGHYVPRRSIYDPLYKTCQAPQPIQQPQAVYPYQPPRLPMAEPSPTLLAGLQPRATTPNGLPTNDRVFPEQLVAWQQKGGFWGKVANYYVVRHEAAASVYRSPFAPKVDHSMSLADTFYHRLSELGQFKVDDARGNQMRN